MDLKSGGNLYNQGEWWGNWVKKQRKAGKGESWSYYYDLRKGRRRGRAKEGFRSPPVEKVGQTIHFWEKGGRPANLKIVGVKSGSSPRGGAPAHLSDGSSQLFSSIVKYAGQTFAGPQRKKKKERRHQSGFPSGNQTITLAHWAGSPMRETGAALKKSEK